MLLEPLSVEPELAERLTRYLVSERHFRPSLLLRVGAFEPNTGERGLETSVYRTIGLNSDEVWELGRLYVEPGRGHRVRARADISVRDVVRHQLRVGPDEPPPRHAVVYNWPESKDERLLILQQLKADARVELAPATD